ncbi:MAG TPA: hypothetical protein VK097_11395 [Lentibacillus sp.]|nr:hypothetical protein [Lentibacillus sp.]HLR63025.1 hypothetical protein [Lentibacillus sp.]
MQSKGIMVNIGGRSQESAEEKLNQRKNDVINRWAIISTEEKIYLQKIG